MSQCRVTSSTKTWLFRARLPPARGRVRIVVYGVSRWQLSPGKEERLLQHPTGQSRQVDGSLVFVDESSLE